MSMHIEELPNESKDVKMPPTQLQLSAEKSITTLLVKRIESWHTISPKPGVLVLKLIQMAGRAGKFLAPANATWKDLYAACSEWDGCPNIDFYCPWSGRRISGTSTSQIELPPWITDGRADLDPKATIFVIQRLEDLQVAFPPVELEKMTSYPTCTSKRQIHEIKELTENQKGLLFPWTIDVQDYPDLWANKLVPKGLSALLTITISGPFSNPKHRKEHTLLVDISDRPFKSFKVILLSDCDHPRINGARIGEIADALNTPAATLFHLIVYFIAMLQGS